jgi:adenosine/AMP kinase
VEIKTIEIDNGNELNFILGQSHFIKTIEDLYEICITSSTGIKFGIAFCEASGPCLIRHTGNDEALEDLAIKNMKNIAAGHSFIIILENAFPINILNQVKNCAEVCRIYCATANKTMAIIADNEEGRGIMGVIDGFAPKGVENDEDIRVRKEFLRKIGYKK